MERPIQSIRIRYTGRLPLTGKVVELPIPLISKSEKTGQVICNPIGEFDPENGRKLLDLGGAFELEEIVYGDVPESESEPERAIVAEHKPWPEARKAYEARPAVRRRRRRRARNQFSKPVEPAIETPIEAAQGE